MPRLIPNWTKADRARSVDKIVSINPKKDRSNVLWEAEQNKKIKDYAVPQHIKDAWMIVLRLRRAIPQKNERRDPIGNTLRRKLMTNIANHLIKPYTIRQNYANNPNGKPDFQWWGAYVNKVGDRQACCTVHASDYSEAGGPWVNPKKQIDL